MSPRKKWLKFDLHIHTDRSDGKDSLRQMLKTAKRRGLDVVAVTDHNIPNSFNTKRASEKYGIYVIPGCELSLLSGHLLILGMDPKLIEKELKKHHIKGKTCSVIVRKETTRKMLKYFVDNGALIIAAHPKIPSGMMSMKGNFLRELYQKGLVHGMEIHNNSIEGKFKRRLYYVWHHLAKNFAIKFKIPIYSDSDAHTKKQIGSRFNMVKLDDPTKLLEILKKGKIEITHGTMSDL